MADLLSIPGWVAAFCDAFGMDADDPRRADLLEVYETDGLTTELMARKCAAIANAMDERLLLGAPVVVDVPGAVLDLGTLSSRRVEVTSAGPLSDLGSSATIAKGVYMILFRDGRTLVYSDNLKNRTGEDLIIPAGSDVAACYEGDGVWRIMWFAGEPGPAGPAGEFWEMPFSIPFALGSSEELYRVIIARPRLIDAAFCVAAAGGHSHASSQVFTLARNGVTVATVTFATGSATGVVDLVSTSIAASSGSPATLTLTGPASPDAGLTAVSITFGGANP